MKRISLFALALSTSLAVFAQDAKPARTSMDTKPRVGIKGGVNLASLEIDDDTPVTNFNTNSKTSFHVGIYGNIPLGTGMFRLQPELLYVGQGSKVTGTPLSGNQGTTQSYEVDMDYIAVPLMFQLATKGGFFVELGPQFSFLTTARQDNASGSDPDLKDAKVIKKTDFAVLGGLGYTSRIGLGLHATYVHGITNVFDTDNASRTTSPIGGDVSNRGIKIGLHYSFGAHK